MEKMDLAFSDAENAFRQEIGDFISRNLPDDLAEKVRDGHKLEKADHVRWQRILNDRGWAAPNWPAEYGGPGWSTTERYIYDEVAHQFDVPATITMGQDLVGPVIYTFGTDSQKNYFLPRILNYEHWWCQGYSEPGSGSDLASLSTRAVRDGDHYVVNGAKTWTTNAHWADWIFCLVRTDPDAKQQEGISFLLIDMTSPGVEVKPIYTIDGAHHLNNVFFTDVRVPVEQRVGEENKGWTYAKFLLGNERMTIAEVGESKKRLQRLRAIARAEQSEGQSLSEVSSFSSKIAEAAVDLTALEFTALRYLSEEAAGKPIGAEASMLKIKGSELRQKLTELSVEAVGYYALVNDPHRLDDRRNEPPIGPDYAWQSMPDFLHGRAASIYGGSNEIQRNIIAKMVLGL